jgi:hypothetical protein
LAAPLMPMYSQLALAEFRSDTHLACTTAGLAAEQFRLRHQRWPDSIEDLVAADLLPAVPIDVFDGQPLRFRKTPDGIVIYSVGVLRKYEGDARDPERTAAEREQMDFIEFRVWNTECRRQSSKETASKN